MCWWQLELQQLEHFTLFPSLLSFVAETFASCTAILVTGAIIGMIREWAHHPEGCHIFGHVYG
jgi:hypothetical protein